MIDLVLGAVLIFVLPVYMLVSSQLARTRPEPQRTRKYLRTLLVALVLGAALALRWLQTGRSLSSLGLQPPSSPAAWIGVALAICILTGASVAMLMPARKATPARSEPGREIMPQTPAETRLFIVLLLVVGVVWEVLYRGYLLWLLPPHVGLPASIGIAAVAYGLAHGVKSLKLVCASLVSALLFTLAFVATGSLWWLILVHCGLPLLSLFACRRREM